MTKAARRVLAVGDLADINRLDPTQAGCIVESAIDDRMRAFDRLEQIVEVSSARGAETGADPSDYHQITGLIASPKQ